MTSVEDIDRDLAFMRAALELAEAKGDILQADDLRVIIDQGLDARLEASGQGA